MKVLSNHPRCACPGCFRVLNQGMEFCRDHWGVLPKELRNDLYKAQRRPERADAARLAAVKWLEQELTQTRKETGLT